MMSSVRFGSWDPSSGSSGSVPGGLRFGSVRFLGPPENPNFFFSHFDDLGVSDLDRGPLGDSNGARMSFWDALEPEF